MKIDVYDYPLVERIRRLEDAIDNDRIVSPQEARRQLSAMKAELKAREKKRRGWKKVAALFAGIALVLSLAGGVSATGGKDHKVGICHRTASDSNPYVFITVDTAAEVKAHIGADAHPPKHGRYDYLATRKSDCKVKPTPTPTPAGNPTPTPTPTPPTPVSHPNNPTLPPTDMASDVANAVVGALFTGWQWFLVMAFVVGLAFGANIIMRKR